MGLAKWVLPKTDPMASKLIAQELGVSSLIADIMVARNYYTPQAVQDFISDEARLSDPFEITDMDKACQRIEQAIENEERIAVYGDYDADGVTATAMLFLYLESSGADVTTYIPSREDEGYGMNRDAVKQLADEGVSLLITVDNGIAAVDEIDYAQSLGVTVIVTDHHRPKAQLPNAYAVVDPHRADCTSGFKDLCGAGLALKLIAALCGGEYDEVFDFCADIAAIGTIADVVPLTGENRIIVNEGLCRLAETQNVGLTALMELCEISPESIDSVTVAYQLVPRINAAGRLGLAQDALRMLITDDYIEAQEIAVKINENNIRRKELDGSMLSDIDEELIKRPAFSQKRAAVIAKQGWHPGVAGIAAAKLVDRIAKPAFVVCIEGDTARGSARGVSGFSVFDALVYCDNLLLRYGGHEAAGGFTLKTEDIPAFGERIEAYCAQTHPFMPVHSIAVDVVCHPADITVETLNQFSLLEPFGCCNEPVRFAFTNMRISLISPIGAGKHLRVTMEKDGRQVSAVLFGTTPQDFAYQPGDEVDVVAICDRNVYQGRESVSIKIKDIRPSSFVQDEYFMSRELCERFWNDEAITSAQKNSITPTREDIAVVYRAIAQSKTFSSDIAQLAAATLSNYGKTKNAVKVLSELGLVRVAINNNKYNIAIVKDALKADLARSDTMQRLLSAT